MSKLQSTTMAFGDKFSPTAVTKAQVEAILRSIEDADNTTNYSGYISMAVDSINAAEEFTLAANGITFQGAVTPVEFSVRADRTSISDDSNITFYTEGLPFPSLIFSVKEVTVTKGEISADEVKSLCSFNGNILHVAAANMPYEWAASIVVNVETRFTPKTEHAVTINCKVKPYTAVIVSESNVNMIDGETKTINLSYSPADGTIPVVQVDASLSTESLTYSIVSASPTQIVLRCNNTDVLDPATLNIVATDKAGNTLRSQVSLTNKVIPAIIIEGEDSFVAKNGNGSANYSFGINPSQYNVPVSLVSVTSNNGAVTVTYSSIEGFSINAAGITSNTNVIVSAIFNIDGVNITLNKSVDVTYVEELDPIIVEYNLSTDTTINLFSQDFIPFLFDLKIDGEHVNVIQTDVFLEKGAHIVELFPTKRDLVDGKKSFSIGMNAKKCTIPDCISRVGENFVTNCDTLIIEGDSPLSFGDPNVYQSVECYCFNSIRELFINRPIISRAYFIPFYLKSVSDNIVLRIGEKAKFTGFRSTMTYTCFYMYRSKRYTYVYLTKPLFEASVMSAGEIYHNVYYYVNNVLTNTMEFMLNMFDYQFVTHYILHEEVVQIKSNRNVIQSIRYLGDKDISFVSIDNASNNGTLYHKNGVNVSKLLNALPGWTEEIIIE